MHIFFQRQTAATPDPPTSMSDVQARTMEPVSNGLSAVDTDPIDSGNAELGFMHAVAWDDGGTVRMLFVGIRDTGTDERVYIQATVDGSNDIVLDVGYADTAGVVPFVLNGRVGETVVAVDDQNVIHQLFFDASSRDLYYTKSDDNGATWDTPIEIKDGITGSKIWASIYTSKAATVLGYVYGDLLPAPDETRYDEHELSAFDPAYVPAKYFIRKRRDTRRGVV